MLSSIRPFIDSVHSFNLIQNAQNEIHNDKCTMISISCNKLSTFKRIDCKCQLILASFRCETHASGSKTYLKNCFFLFSFILSLCFIYCCCCWNAIIAKNTRKKNAIVIYFLEVFSFFFHFNVDDSFETFMRTSTKMK